MNDMTKKDILIILGTAHLDETAGKRSPDGRLREPYYSREICELVESMLLDAGYFAETDYKYVHANSKMKAKTQKQLQSNELNWRVRYVNERCKEYGKNNCIYVSIHVDASGSGREWMKARGWTVYTSKGQTPSDELATCLFGAAKKYIPADHKHFLRSDYSDGDPDKEANFYVLRATDCPAVLTENLYQDNKEDVDFLLSDVGVNAIVRLHFEGIVNYINKRLSIT